ncbi:hypothetical protein V8E51_002352 [Hyaloscypha variabilis]
MADMFMLVSMFVCIAVGGIIIAALRTPWVTEDTRNAVPTLLIFEGVLVSALTSLSLCSAIRYGQPFGEGHTIDGLICLCSGTVANLLALGYRVYQGPDADRKVIFLTFFGAFYLEIWAFIGTVADIVATSLNYGNKWFSRASSEQLEVSGVDRPRHEQPKMSLAFAWPWASVFEGRFWEPPFSESKLQTATSKKLTNSKIEDSTIS